MESSSEAVFEDGEVVEAGDEWIGEGDDEEEDEEDEDDEGRGTA